jgi:hypothetical protein
MRHLNGLRPFATAVALLAVGWLAAVPAPAQVDGSLDPGFSGDGVLSNGNEPFSIYTPRAVAVLPNQEVVVVGDLAPTLGMDHLRVSVDGNALTECDAAIAQLDEFEGLAVLVDRAGRLMVTGRGTFSGTPDQDRGLVGRFTAASPCTFDNTWSDDGWQTLDGTSFCDDEDCALIDLAESPTESARLYGLLSSRVNSLVARLFVVRFYVNGSVDGTFGVDGYAELAEAGLGTLTSVARLAVDAAGRPLVLASRYDPNSSLDADSFIARFTIGGALDSSFSGNGWIEIGDTDQNDSFPADLVVAADGTLLIGDNVDDVGRIVAIRPDLTTTSRSFTDHRLAGLAAQGNGRMLALLDSLLGDETAVDRLWDDGGASLQHDDSFGPLGRAILDVDLGGANWQQGTAIVLSTGRPWLVGRAAGDSGAGLFAMRLRNRYVFADGFEIGTTSRWRR